MPAFKTLDDLTDIAGKRVLVRVDLNVPVTDGKVSDTTRIERVAPTIHELSEKGAKVILLAHFGRPKGEPVADQSLSLIAPAVEEVLDQSVAFASDCIGAPAADAIAKMKTATSCFSKTPASTRVKRRTRRNSLQSSPRTATSTSTTPSPPPTAPMPRPRALPITCPLMPVAPCRPSWKRWKKGLGQPTRPVVAIVGGAKVSTKIDLLSNLVTKVDALVIGGGMANTFIAAQGINVGKSLCEHDLADTAARSWKRPRRRLLDRAAGRRRGCPRVQGQCRKRNGRHQCHPRRCNDARRRSEIGRTDQRLD